MQDPVQISIFDVMGEIEISPNVNLQYIISL